MEIIGKKVFIKNDTYGIYKGCIGVVIKYERGGFVTVQGIDTDGDEFIKVFGMGDLDIIK
jgi:hypothetical protein